MSRYSLLVTLHVASVIVWLGAGTTLVLVSIYARRTRNNVLVGQLGPLVQWMAIWVLAPSSLLAAGLGLEAARAGHWPELFFFHVGEGAFAFSFLLTVAVRLPLVRRAGRGGVDPGRLPQYLLALAVAESTVLYLAVAAMVVKPTDAGSSVVRYGGLVLALGFLAAAAIAYRARTTGVRGWRVGGFDEEPLPGSSTDSLSTRPAAPVGSGSHKPKGGEMKIVVIGGTGLIGSKLVEKLRERGHELVAAAPDTGVNTVTREGLDEALERAQVVVDVANAPMSDDAAVRDFFQTSTRNVLAAEVVAGVKHHVVLSVVGADRLPESGYLRAKVAQEELVKAASVPYTILRATQFFEFIGRIADSSAEDETVRLAPVYVQPESADDVAAALADVAESEPVNGIVELAGPEQFRLDELARRVLRANNDARPVTADVHARYFGAELGDHSLTPDVNARIAPTRFEDWLGQAVAG